MTTTMQADKITVALKLDMSDFRKQLQLAREESEKGGNAISGAFARAAGASKVLLAGIGGLVGGLGAASLKGLALAGDMEQTSIAFETMLGSAQEAEAFVRQLWDFAARTPFEFQGLTQSARQLLAFGFEARDVIPMMTAVGDAVSALGGGAAEIDRVTRALGQMQAKGKVSAEEMMQLAELGVPAWEMLADSIGVSIPEAMTLAEKGAIDARTGIAAILAGMEERFKGSMDRQSTTLLGLWSTLKDNVSGVLRSLGETIVETFDLKTKLAGAIAWLGDFQKALEEGGIRGALEKMFPENTRLAAIAIAGAITAALLPALWSLATAAWAAIAPLLPFAAAGAALAAVAYLIYDNWDKIVAWFRETWAKFVEWITGVWDRIKAAAVALAVEVATPFVNAFTWLRDQWQTFTGWLGGVWDRFKAWLAELVTGVVSWALKIYDSITAPFRAAVNWLSDTWEAFSTWWHDWWDGLEAWVRGAVDRVLAPIRTIIGWVQDALDWLDKLFGGGESSTTINTPPVSPRASTGNIPMMASGGIVTRPTLALIGERQPEAVVPLDRFIQPAPAAATSGPVTVIVQLDGRTIARATLPHLYHEVALKAGIA